MQTPIANQASTVLRGIFTNPALHLSAAEAAARVASATRLYYTLLERELRLALAAGAGLGDLPSLLATSRRLGTPALVVCAELVFFALAGAPGTGAGAVCTFPALTAQAGQLVAAPWIWDAARALALALDEVGAPFALLRPLAYIRARLEEELVWGPGSEAFSLIAKLAPRAAAAAAGASGKGRDLPAWRGSVYDGPAPLEPPDLVCGMAATAAAAHNPPTPAAGRKGTRAAQAATPTPPLSRLQTAACAAVEAELVIADLLTMVAHRLQVRSAAAARLLAAGREAAGHAPLPRSYVAACALSAAALAASHVELLFGQHLSALAASIVYGSARAFNVAVPLKAAAAAAQAAAPHVWPDQVSSASIMAPLAPPRPSDRPPGSASPTADLDMRSCRLKYFYDGAFLDAMADELRRTASTACLGAGEASEEEEDGGGGEGGDAMQAALVKAHALAARTARAAAARPVAGTKRGLPAAGAAAASAPPLPKRGATGKRPVGRPRGAKAAAAAAAAVEEEEDHGAAPAPTGAAAGVAAGVAAELTHRARTWGLVVGAAAAAPGPAAAAAPKPAPRLPLKVMTAEDVASRGNVPPGRRG
jgi:hypothetical protein